jgi:hypothetical protein
MREQDIGKDAYLPYAAGIVFGEIQTREERQRQRQRQQLSRPRRFVTFCADEWKYLIVYFN